MTIIVCLHLTARLSVDFPYWKRLHGFWRTILTFNPYLHSAEHGQDLAVQAQEFVTGGRKAKGKEKEKECEESNEDDGIEVQSGDDTHLVDVMPVSPSLVVPPRLFGNAAAVSVVSRDRKSVV